MDFKNIPREEVLADMWTLSMQYPGKMQSILSKLESDFDIGEPEFSEYSRQRNISAQVNILDQRALALEEIEGFSQIDTMSDVEILRVFEARDELNAQIEDVKRSVPTDTEWYKAGLDAEQRIAQLRPFYETKKEEEWGYLESPLPAPFQPLMGPIGFLTELVAGGTDWRYDFGEKLHERGGGTSWNPLTGFGAWDIAEFKVDPETGRSGFSSELLAMENELEKLYGTKRTYEEKMIEGGYRDVYGINEEIVGLNQIISEGQLIDPRLRDQLLGETQ